MLRVLVQAIELLAVEGLEQRALGNIGDSSDVRDEHEIVNGAHRERFFHYDV